ncbi:hypothetical protein M3Y99_01362700 [Aphelenchoides fujianensis]|nr:hypothetical protein M3Y99_01362700 [Aphelenchoides fujianensis]
MDLPPLGLEAETSAIFRESTMLAEGGGEGGHFFEMPPTMPPPGPIDPLHTQTAMSGTQKAHQWFVQHNRFQDSGIQSMENSKAPSIVSMNTVGKTAGEEGSCYLVNEPFDPAAHQPPANPPNAAAPACLSTETENAKRVLPELIPLLEDADEEVACRALEMVIHIAKLDAAQPFSEPVITQERRIIRLTLCALFHISNRPQGMQLILQSLEQRSRGLVSFLSDLVRCTGIAELACFKYALLILHNLMTERSVSRRVVECIREQKAMSTITEWLNETNEKLLSIIVDAFFIALNGPSLLCGILSWARYENLLWRCTRLLKSVSLYDPQKIVDSGAYDVLPLNMDHASQRLVFELLSCTRDLSDMSTTKLDVSHLLSRLVQLLGTNDMEVRQLCIQSLANFSANNRRNKEFLFQMDILNTLRHVLYDTEAMMDELNASRQLIEVLEDIQETALTALRNLYSGHQFEREVQQRLLAQNGAQFFLRKFQQMRPALVRKSLLLLSKAATLDANIPIFRHECLQTAVDCETNFAERLVYVLFTKAIEKVNLAELMHLSMLTLQRLCRDEIAYYLKEYPLPSPAGPLLLPCAALSLNDEAAVQAAISLLGELLEVPEIVMSVAADQQAVRVLESWCLVKNSIGATAHRILKSVHSVGRQSLPPPSHANEFALQSSRTPQDVYSPDSRGGGLFTPQHAVHELDGFVHPMGDDSGYQAADSSTEFLVSPPDEFYTHLMAERYQSMNLASLPPGSSSGMLDPMDADRPSSSAQMSTPRTSRRSQPPPSFESIGRPFG